MSFFLGLAAEHSTIHAATPVVTSGQSTPGTTVGNFSYQVAANNTPTSFALASGSLPAGITLNTSNGLLTGTAHATGTFTPGFTATNADGTSPAVAVTITITANTAPTNGLVPNNKSIGPIWFKGDSITQSNADLDSSSSPRKSLYDLLLANSYTFSYTGHSTSNTDGLPNDANYTSHSGVSGAVIGTPDNGRYNHTVQAPVEWVTGRLNTVKPRVVLIMLGTNDVEVLANILSEAPARLSNLIDTLYALPGFGNPTVFIASVPPTRRTLQRTANVATFNAALPSVVNAQADLGRDVRFVDNFTPLNSNFDAFMQPDNLHTNAAGNGVMAQQWFDGINAVAGIATTTPVITASQSSLGRAGVDFRYQIKATQNPTSYVLSSGSLPPGVTLNTSTGRLSGLPTMPGAYTPVFTATNAFGTSATVSVALNFSPPDTGSLIVYEPFDYALGSTNTDPDSGLNSASGLPATNVGGDLSGIGTGFRTSWSASVTTSAALTYSQGSKTFVTSGLAATKTATGDIIPVGFYRSMVTDPFLDVRVGNTSSGNLGKDGTVIYFSALVRIGTFNAVNDRARLTLAGANQLYVGLNGTDGNWTLASQTAPTSNTNNATPVIANTTTLIVGRYTFNPTGTDDIFDLWVNPTLGGTLGTPAASIAASNIDFGSFGARSTVANQLQFDEIRFGTSYSAVTPHTQPTDPVGPVAPSGLNATANSTSAISLTWADTATNEAGFKLERSTVSTIGWTQIATLAPNTASYTDAGLSANTAYYYRVRATNFAVDSAYTSVANATPGTTGWNISGTITASGTGLVGVSVSDGTRTATTAADGTYTLTGVPAGSYTLTPTRTGYVFSPGTLAATVSSANLTVQNFTATLTASTFTVSGTITASGTGLVGVSVSDGTRTATTAANGTYTLTGVPAGSYTLTPTRTGYVFSPGTLAATVSSANLTAQNFTAALVAPVITSGQSASGNLSQSLTYQILTSNSPTSYALASGTLPPGVSLNTSTGVLSGTPTTIGTYTPAFTATNAGGTSPAVAITLNISPTDAGSVIVYEPFNYPLGTNEFDPDAGVNSGNGLPFTNVGGTPAGTSTGLRNVWHSSFTATAALTYTQGTKTFVTSGLAATKVASAETFPIFLYRNMTTDPFVALRVGNAVGGNFGRDGTVIYFSALVRIGTYNPTDIARLNFAGSNILYVGLTGSSNGNWALGAATPAGTTITNNATPVTANATTLLVVRCTFNPTGTNDIFEIWVNPTLGGTLGTPAASIAAPNLDFNGIGARTTSTNQLEIDELRMGTSYAAVTPHTEATTGLAAFRTTYGLAPDGSQDRLTPAGDGVENLLKYAFNMLGTGTGQVSTLTTPNAAVLTANGSAGLPFVSLLPAPGSQLQITYIRRKATATPAPGITYAVEFSEDLVSWAVNPLATETTVIDLDATFERVTVTDNVASPAKRFVRVRITAL